MKDLRETADFINKLSNDLRAEILLSQILDRNIDPGEILVALDGQLKRRYSKDKDHARVDEFESGERSLVIHLNRDGLYDALPEALFHKFSDASLIGGDEMAKDSMRLRSEEKEARSFFLPFESQIMMQRARLAQKEDNLIKKIYSRQLQGLLPGFWNIDRDIPRGYYDRLVRLIPMAHKIVGEKDLTVDAFEYILQEKVSIDIAEMSYGNGSEMKVERVSGLGEDCLGIDMICGKSPELSGRSAIITVGPLRGIDISDLIGNNWLNKLMENMCGYFIPLEMQFRTNLIPAEATGEFLFPSEDSESKAYLGFNTVL